NVRCIRAAVSAEVNWKISPITTGSATVLATKKISHCTAAMASAPQRRTFEFSILSLPTSNLQILGQTSLQGLPFIGKGRQQSPHPRLWALSSAHHFFPSTCLLQ